MPTILVVEDELNIRKFISLNLSIRHYQVIEADCAETALAYLTTTDHPPTAMVLDISLPGMDGWTMLSTIEADPAISAIPVVVISGSPPLSETSRRDFDNVVEVLDKPISTQALLDVVRRAAGDPN